MLKEIRVNCIGMCDKFMTVVIQDDKLEEMKQKQMREVTCKHGREI